MKANSQPSPASAELDGSEQLPKPQIPHTPQPWPFPFPLRDLIKL
jgi:hypothetical protein